MVIDVIIGVTYFEKNTFENYQKSVYEIPSEGVDHW